MRHRLHFPLAVLILSVFSSANMVACAHIYPITTGSHAPIGLHEPIHPDKKYRIVVWATHPAIASTVMSMAQQTGYTVVERSRLDQVFKEQEIRLTHTSDDDAQVLKVGKLVGAEYIIFAEHIISSSVQSEAFIGAFGGGSYSQTIYQVSVAVRGVNVETGEVRFSGTAYYPSPITNPEAQLPFLTHAAITRALCPIESGYEWKEYSRFEQGGCRKKD